MTPEQQKLLQKADRGLQAVRLLQQQELFEFAITRAYYTMFYAAEAMLIGRGLSFSTHSGVLSAFGKQFVRSGEVPKEFHQALITAEQARIQGDYDIDEAFSEADAIRQLQQAEAFLEMAKSQIG
ncbi:HEPN domain-containing protein [Leptolyngbya sp. FACHB-17]|uniref:HEPN domain-containing protein n=1 Tax=unclassified Leptolyngbya TaxID=2650499 RepID=UPI0016807D28|nr:HEPN domain-containing protein [Leptolyngbya sp. FACHB-17]MBD2082444.1 HEPN domain-containing protein [Leptolyngbya sp. FACHB-17]